MTDTGWRRNKYGGWFNINEVMNNKIRNIEDYDEDEERFKQDHSNLLYENQNFSYEQKNAIREWTTDDGYGASDMINDVLNGKKQVSDGVRKIIDEKVNILQSTITQPINKDIYTYYGTEIDPKSLSVGKKIENKGFTPTSIYKYDAGVFSNIQGSGSLIKIKIKKETKALYIGEKTSFHRNEHELLFGKGHSIKITKIEKLFDEDGDFMNYDIVGELI